jgi:hypothetical protein
MVFEGWLQGGGNLLHILLIFDLSHRFTLHHQFCRSDVIGGHYCIENRFDVIIIHAHAIDMVFEAWDGQGAPKSSTGGLMDP